jgi:hypothetical protein
MNPNDIMLEILKRFIQWQGTGAIKARIDDGGTRNELASLSL